MNGNCMIVFTTLNIPCENAIVSFGLKPNFTCKYAMNDVNGAKNIKNIVSLQH